MKKEIKRIRPKYPLESSPFTVEGYNDEPKSCLNHGCNGTVKPTVAANVGECDKCHSRFSWAKFL